MRRKKKEEELRLGGIKKRGLSRRRALEMVRARWEKRHRYDLTEVGKWSSGLEEV